MPREQFITPAGVAAGGPFFLLGFLPLDFLLVGFFLVGFLPLGLPERLGSATLREPGIFRTFFGRVPSESGRDLPGCRRMANPDHFQTVFSRNTVAKRQAVAEQQIPTVLGGPTEGSPPERKPPEGSPTEGTQQKKGAAGGDPCRCDELFA